MHSRGLVALAAFLMVGVCASARGEGQFPLEKIAISGRPPSVAKYAEQFVRGERQKPSTVKGAPKVSANAVYYVGSFGDEQVVMLCDLGAEHKLYVDTDQDGDLSDETAITSGKKAAKKSMLQILTGGGGGRSSQEAKFGPISLVLTGSGATVEFNVEVMHQSSQYGYLYLRSAAYRSGEVELAGKSYLVNVVDASFDGRYDKRFTAEDPYGSDWIAVDLDRNGVMQQTTSGPSEVIPLPGMIRAGEAYYGIEVMPDGSAIRVEAVQPEFGALAVEAEDVFLTLWSDSGCHAVASAQGPRQLPAGSYRAIEVLLTRKDEKGRSWRCRSYGDTGKLADIRIPPGETVSIKAGEPLRSNVTFTGGRGTAYLGFSLGGQAGEEYAAGADRDGRRQGAPTFKILSESDKVLVSASFEYG